MSFINSVSLSSTSFNFSNSFNFAGIQGVSNTTLLGMQGIVIREQHRYFRRYERL